MASKVYLFIHCNMRFYVFVLLPFKIVLFSISSLMIAFTLVRILYNKFLLPNYENVCCLFRTWISLGMKAFLCLQYSMNTGSPDSGQIIV